MAALIEINILSAYGPNSINRDGTGNVKHMIVGGDDRTVFSSACKKHGLREYFSDKYGKTYHTRKMVNLLMEKAEALGYVEGKNKDAWAKAFDEILRESSKKKDKGEKKEQMLTYSDAEADFIVEYVREHGFKVTENYKNDLRMLLKYVSIGIELALFGRFNAGGVGAVVPSSLHLNFSYSIDDYAGDFDYFTACDNYVESSGAGHIDHSSIASNTMYSYGNIDPVQMYRNLARAVHWDDLSEEDSNEKKKDLKREVKERLIEYIVRHIFMSPSGKQTAMATYPVPTTVYIRVLKDGYPNTADNAFNRVIRTVNGKYPVSVEGARRLVNFVRYDEPIQETLYKVLCFDSVAREKENWDYIGVDDELTKEMKIGYIRDLSGAALIDLGNAIDEILATA